MSLIRMDPLAITLDFFTQLLCSHLRMKEENADLYASIHLKIYLILELSHRTDSMLPYNICSAHPVFFSLRGEKYPSDR
jgi:hypothetical protein